MKKRTIFIELTSLLDVILIMIFVLLTQARAQTTEAIDDAAADRAALKEIRRELKDEQAAAASREESLAAKIGALESKAAFKGLVKKALIVVIVVAFHQADKLTGKSFFRNGACWAFFIAELISVVENVGLVYPLPSFIRRALEWLRKKGEHLGHEEMHHKERKTEEKKRHEQDLHF